MSREIMVGVVDGGNLCTKNQTSFKGKRYIRIPETLLIGLKDKALVLLLVRTDAVVDFRMVFTRSENMLILDSVDFNGPERDDHMGIINNTSWLDYALTSLPHVTRVAWNSKEIDLQPDLQGYQTIGGIPNVTVVGRADDQLHH